MMRTVTKTARRSIVLLLSICSVACGPSLNDERSVRSTSIERALAEIACATTASADAIINMRAWVPGAQHQSVSPGAGYDHPDCPNQYLVEVNHTAGHTFSVFGALAQLYGPADPQSCEALHLEAAEYAYNASRAGWYLRDTYSANGEWYCDPSSGYCICVEPGYLYDLRPFQPAESFTTKIRVAVKGSYFGVKKPVRAGIVVID
ncbi:MAG: hypothetical protein IT381_19200 [Deltaproteobacteria bacterium]|nr:hypothetical protein [Deltaproteobacteria bacterium]